MVILSLTHMKLKHNIYNLLNTHKNMFDTLWHAMI